MAPNTPDVKQPARLSPGLRFLMWIDCHPRTGWYVVALLLFNTLLNIIDVLK